MLGWEGERPMLDRSVHLGGHCRRCCVLRPTNTTSASAAAEEEAKPKAVGQ